MANATSNKKTISPLNARGKIWQNKDPKTKDMAFLVESKTFVPIWDGNKYVLGPVNDRLSEKEINDLVKSLKFVKPDGTIIKEANIYNKEDEFFTHRFCKIKMTKDSRVFDLNIPKDRLGYLIMAADPMTVLTKANLNKNPKAQWVIEDEEKEAELELDNMENEIKTVEVFSKLPISKKRIILTCFGIPNDLNIPDSVISNKLWNLLKADSPINNAKELFLNLTSEKEGKLHIIYTVNKGLQYSVLRMKGQEIMFNGTSIAKSKQELIEKLNLPENSALFLNIEEAIKIKHNEKY